jgi:hypothetical protein
MHLTTLALLPLLSFSGSVRLVAGYVAQARLEGPTCTRTTVAILYAPYLPYSPLIVQYGNEA